MGDRTGLTKLDRTNGYEDGRGYMKVKKSKLAQQNDQIRDALRHRNSTMRTDLFKGVSINVNGRTQPTADELKRLILLNGGDYHPYYRYQTTKFMIATNLSIARMKQLRPDDRVVKPEWITESIQAKCLLPYQDYQLFVDEPRGKNGVVLAIDSDTSNQGGQQSTSNQLVPVAESYTRNYRKTRQQKQQNNPDSQGKNRDIREMFSKSVKSLDQNGSRKNCIDLSGSQISNGDSNSSDAIVNNNDLYHEDSNSKSNHPTDQMPQFALDESSNSNLSTRPPTTSSKTTSSKTTTNGNNKKKPTTMKDFVVHGTRKQDCFLTPKVMEPKQYIANICGLTRLDGIIGLLNEWVGCPEGITDEDTACVTKYFYDLMREKDYHNKFYEIIYAFQQRVLQHDEKIWIELYNDLVTNLKLELNQNIGASQNLCQLIDLIDVSAGQDDDNKVIALPTVDGDDDDDGKTDISND